MRQTVGQQDFHVRQLWRVPRESVAHLNGRIPLCRALLQNIGEILARMFPAGKVQRDAPLPPDRNDAAGEGSRAPVAGVAHQLQYPHARVIVVNHAALRRLPDQLLQYRFQRTRGRLHQLPLSGCR